MSAGSLSPSAETICSLTLGVAVAVSAWKGTPGPATSSLKSFSARYAGRKSWPQLATQCASSTAIDVRNPLRAHARSASRRRAFDPRLSGVVYRSRIPGPPSSASRRRSRSIRSVSRLSAVPHQAAAFRSRSSHPRSWSRRSERRGVTTTVTPGRSISSRHIAGSWYTMLLPKPVGSVARQSRPCCNARTASSCASLSDAPGPSRALSMASNSSLSEPIFISC